MRLLLVLSATALLIRPALGAPTPDALAEAKRHFEAGDKAFKLQDFERAIAEYRAAYDAVPQPALLFDLGQAYRKASRFEMAIHSYQQYLNDAPPDAPLRDKAEELVAELKLQVAKVRQAQDQPPDGVLPSADAQRARTEPVVIVQTQPRRWYREPAGWVIGGIGLAATATGVGLLSQSLAIDDQANAAASAGAGLPVVQGLQTSANNYQIAGWSLVGIGGAALLTSVIVFVALHVHHASPRPRIESVLNRLRTTSLIVGGAL